MAKDRIRQFEDMQLTSQLMKMFLYSFGRAWNENHIDFFFPFSYLPLICCVGDSDTVAAEGNLAVMKVFVLFQWFSVDEKDAEASCGRGLTKYQVLCQGPPHAAAYLFCIHLVQGV